MTRYRRRRPLALAAFTIIAISVQLVAGSNGHHADRVSLHRPATSTRIDASTIHR